MESLYDHTTEDSIKDLAEAGLTVDIKITSRGGAARFIGSITHGTGLYGGKGFHLSVEADGADGASALRGLIATAETYLHTVRPVPPRVPAPVSGGAIAGSLLLRVPDDDLRTANRAANRDLAEQHDELAAELVGADEQGLGR